MYQDKKSLYTYFLNSFSRLRGKYQLNGVTPSRRSKYCGADVSGIYLILRKSPIRLSRQTSHANISADGVFMVTRLASVHMSNADQRGVHRAGPNLGTSKPSTATWNDTMCRVSLIVNHPRQHMRRCVDSPDTSATNTLQLAHVMYSACQ